MITKNSHSTGISSTFLHLEFILAVPKLGRKTEWFLGDYLTCLTTVPREKMKCVVF
jgi:hypothetical protein